MTKKEDMTTLPIIGRNTTIDFIGHVHGVPAKVDTGADSSSVWVSNIQVDIHGQLSFTFFDPSSPLYTGKVVTRTDYAVAAVRSSNGEMQVRYRTYFSVRIHGRRVRAVFNLSDRSRNIFPVLVGRRTLQGKFLVDVSQYVYKPEARSTTDALQDELQQDPYKFHKKYYKTITEEHV